VDKFLDALDLQKENINLFKFYLSNRSVTRNDVEALIKFPDKEKSVTQWIHLQILLYY
jgi:hypothetical protein